MASEPDGGLEVASEVKRCCDPCKLPAIARDSVGDHAFVGAVLMVLCAGRAVPSGETGSMPVSVASGKRILVPPMAFLRTFHTLSISLLPVSHSMPAWVSPVSPVSSR